MTNTKFLAATAIAAPVATAALAALAMAACTQLPTNPGTNNSSTKTTVAGYQVESLAGGALAANVGDTLKFCAAPGTGCQAIVEETMSDGSTASLPSGAVLDFSSNFPTIVARKGYETNTETSNNTNSQNNPPGLGVYPLSEAAGVFVENPIADRPDGLKLHGVLFVTHKGPNATGQIPVHVQVSGVAPGGVADTVVTVDNGMPTGNVANGAALFRGKYSAGGHVANCAMCHGMNGEGSPAIDANGDAWLPWTNLEPGAATASSDNPAPVLNFTGSASTPPDGNTGNMTANFKNWSPVVFSFAARADVDNTGAWLELPMPQWLTQPAADGKPLTAQDFADMWAFLSQDTATPSNGTTAGFDTPIQP